MQIGIDDTDSPAGMCTTYLGVLLKQRLKNAGIAVGEVRLVRLNPNIPWKTRGNAAIAIKARGLATIAFELACTIVQELAALSCPETNPGVVVTTERLPSSFYWKAVRGFCTQEEAVALLEEHGAFYRGYKNGRGLIGATAAIAAEMPDYTYELLTYRSPDRWGTPREVDRASFFRADTATFPHTWDTVDRENDLVVCVPHTPDPVLYGIRGERPGWLRLAQEEIISEPPCFSEIFVTNQGTDSHLEDGRIGSLIEGCSYRVEGIVAAQPETRRGGHVVIPVKGTGGTLPCRAFEPTRQFRDVIRSLAPGDRVLACGSFRRGSLNLEKIEVREVAPRVLIRPPLCPRCEKRMTSAGNGKGYKCRRCGGRAREPARDVLPCHLTPGWYEVPPSARRHLSRPLCRNGRGDSLMSLPPINTP